MVRLDVESGDTSFGIVDTSFGIVALNEVIPTWKWFIGRLGVCLWVVSDKGLPSGTTTEACIHHETSKVNWGLLSRVDVVLVQGLAGPPLSHSVWTLPEVRLIVWSNHRMRKEDTRFRKAGNSS